MGRQKEVSPVLFWTTIVIALLIVSVLFWWYNESGTRGGFTEEQKRQLERMFPPGTKLQGGVPGAVPSQR
ncbi:MAG: hypothetical protein RMM08_01535 [Armatimonadota bacterium]|nr:hypothetical protein [bacterium]MDW8320019.1 hypothetical protein [Armatimonadota bacterium]